MNSPASLPQDQGTTQNAVNMSEVGETEDCETCGGTGEVDTHEHGSLPCPSCVSHELRARAMAAEMLLQDERFNHNGTREHLRLAREEIEKLESRIYQLNAASGKTGPV